MPTIKEYAFMAAAAYDERRVDDLTRIGPIEPILSSTP